MIFLKIPSDGICEYSLTEEVQTVFEFINAYFVCREVLLYISAFPTVSRLFVIAEFNCFVVVLRLMIDISPFL